jgi:Rod binding domain-containing protein
MNLDSELIGIAHGLKPVAEAPHPGPGASSDKIRAAAEDFEAVFLAEMLRPMFESLQTDGMFGGGSSERIYQSIMVQEYGKSMANSNSIGIADMVERELLKMQEIDQ